MFLLFLTTQKNLSLLGATQREVVVVFVRLDDSFHEAIRNVYPYPARNSRSVVIMRESLPLPSLKEGSQEIPR